MKNQYFGDVNDYRKYGLLRALGQPGLRIHVAWMLTPDDGRTDGRYVAYLEQPERWRSFDPVLFDQLFTWLNVGRRKVRLLEESALLPNTRFSSQSVPEDPTQRTILFEQFLADFGEAQLAATIHDGHRI